MTPSKTGVLLTNIGTPETPTPSGVRKYLKKFLSDPRVVELPRWLWLPILHAIILQVRPKRSATLYQKIWHPNTGSPLLHYSLQIAQMLQQELAMPVEIGMHYSNPLISEALTHLAPLEKIIILPLYPQYSATTTASTFDAVTRVLQTWRDIPSIEFIHDYADHPDYIAALAHSITTTWQQRGRPQHLLFSFHGIPERYVKAGDPYAARCQLTAELVAHALQLPQHAWSVAFQSRLGAAAWLTPYTEKVLEEFPKRKVTNLQVICPGFAVDCLETLEEIAIRGKETFLNSGGKEFYYIPALNSDKSHIQLLRSLICNKF